MAFYLLCQLDDKATAVRTKFNNFKEFHLKPMNERNEVILKPFYYSIKASIEHFKVLHRISVLTALKALYVIRSVRMKTDIDIHVLS